MHWSMPVPNQCRHYQKHTVAYHFFIVRCFKFLERIDTFKKKKHTHYIYHIYNHIHRHMTTSIYDRPYDHYFAPSALGQCELKVASLSLEYISVQ